jgi:hypothetical protein
LSSKGIIAASDVPAWPGSQRPGQAKPWLSKPSQATRPSGNLTSLKNFEKSMLNHKNIQKVYFNKKIYNYIRWMLR